MTFTQPVRIGPRPALNTTAQGSRTPQGSGAPQSDRATATRAQRPSRVQPEADINLRALRGEESLSLDERLGVLRGTLRLNARALGGVAAQEVRDLQLAGRLTRELQARPHDAGVQGRVTRLCRARLGSSHRARPRSGGIDTDISTDAARWLLTQARVTLLLALPDTHAGEHPSDRTLQAWRELDGAVDLRAMDEAHAPLAAALTGRQWKMGGLGGPHAEQARAVITRLRRHELARPTDLASLLRPSPLRGRAHDLSGASLHDLLRALPGAGAFVHPDWERRINVVPERGLSPLRRGTLGRLNALHLSSTDLSDPGLNTLCLLGLSHAEFRAVWPRDAQGYAQLSPLEQLQEGAAALRAQLSGQTDPTWSRALRMLDLTLTGMLGLTRAS